MNSHFPIKDLINSENCDYAYNAIDDYEEVTYEKFSKSYDEVINDFIALSRRNVQFLFYSTQEVALNYTKYHHYLHKNTLYRFIEEFPS